MNKIRFTQTPTTTPSTPPPPPDKEDGPYHDAIGKKGK